MVEEECYVPSVQNGQDSGDSYRFVFVPPRLALVGKIITEVCEKQFEDKW